MVRINNRICRTCTPCTWIHMASAGTITISSIRKTIAKQPPSRMTMIFPGGMGIDSSRSLSFA